MFYFQYVLAAVLVGQGCLAAMNARITDGQESPPHQYPYLVSIIWGAPPIFKFRHVCGGAILNENWVLTAGHCITELPFIGHIGVNAGKHIINVEEVGQQFSEVALKVVHWKYTGGIAEHDIALLKLKTPFVFNINTKAIKLPTINKVHTGDVTISGWGSTSKKIVPILPAVLQHATVPIVETKICAAIFESSPGFAQIYDTQICTGPLGGSVSACSGDSGGPLIQRDVIGVEELVGIVSWGGYPCGSGVPSVYTRVSSYIDWINDKLDS